MENLIFTANTVAPVFLIVILGFFLRRTGLLNENFVNISSKIVFLVALPIFVFMELSDTDFHTAFNLKQIVFVYIGTIIFFVFSWFISGPLIKTGRDRAVFIQGSLRGNFAIVGFAVISNMLGSQSQALGKAAILLAFILPLYNVLSVVALTIPLHREKKISLNKTVAEIITNPLILAAVIALPFSYFKISLPQILLKTGDYLSSLTLPLALLSIGGSLNSESIKRDSRITVFSTLIKIVIIPFTLTVTAYQLGFSGEDLCVLFILFASPTAISSFAMAEALGGNSELAGNIILMTTLGSVFTISFGIFIIKSLCLM